MSFIKGIYTVMTTPFSKDESIDYDGFASNLEWLLDRKPEGIIVAGALGEYMSLNIKERKSLCEFALNIAKDKTKVIVGTTSHKPQDVIELTNHAKEHGASGVMILPPPSYSLTQEEIFTFYELVCSEVNIPIMVYNNPYSSGMDIELKTLKKIVHLANIAAIKESSGDIKRTSQIRNELDGKITPIVGWEDMAYEALSTGAKGCISMGANFAIEHLNEIYQLLKKDNREKAWQHYRKYMPIAYYLENGGKVTQTCKYIMDKMGLIGGYSRLPKQPLNDDEKQEITKLLKDFLS